MRRCARPKCLRLEAPEFRRGGGSGASHLGLARVEGVIELKWAELVLCKFCSGAAREARKALCTARRISCLSPTFLREASVLSKRADIQEEEEELGKLTFLAVCNSQTLASRNVCNATHFEREG